MSQIIIKYIGHSCFKLTAADVEIVIDPYADGQVPGLEPVREEADFVFCSHEHFDHNYREGVSIRSELSSTPFSVTELMIPHDDCDGAKRGNNIVHIFKINGLRIAHMGDIGRTLTPEEAEKLSDVDCMLIPVGGYYTVDAEAARTIITQTTPKVVIPMHYRSEGIGFDVLSTVEPFIAGVDNVEYGDHEYFLTIGITGQQVVVLKPAAASK